MKLPSQTSTCPVKRDTTRSEWHERHQHEWTAISFCIHTLKFHLNYVNILFDLQCCVIFTTSTTIHNYESMWPHQPLNLIFFSSLPPSNQLAFFLFSWRLECKFKKQNFKARIFQFLDSKRIYIYSQSF